MTVTGSTVHASPLAPDWLDYPEDPNALVTKLWAAGVERNDDGEITVQGLPVSQLARDYGTPLLVLDEDDFRSRARAFRDAFNEAFADLCGGVDVYYAGKSFLCTPAARWVKEEGLRLDTASGGEMATALRAGVEPAHIGLHGNNKSDDEMRRALAAGVGRIVVDSLDELDRLTELAAEAGAVAPVMLRLTPGVHAHTHEFIATAHEDQKFGLSMVGPDGSAGTAGAAGTDGSPAAEAVARALAAGSIDLRGLHCHIGSQIFEPEGFGVAAEKLLGFLAEIKAEHGVELEELDLGGGHGIAYTAADAPRTPQDIATTLAGVVGAACAALGMACPRISIEPGRAISGPAAFTLYEAGVRKTVTVDGDQGATHPRRYVSVDGGMSDNARPVLYEADYSVALASRASGAPAVLSRVVGKHCESGDIVVKDAYLPDDVARGDLLAVPATGAYCHSLSSNYNMLTRPAVVAVRGGQARVIIRRETEEDLFARETGL
ncbi:diaminopimelate decarboxylase [Citricoccus muralis]|uniref:Diaminopimelate decarboxylase n=1 Tax=Citricoccus muralis TaxID=169134 RepID=A0A3D9L8H5_9MICC|nr:diaminopimelate decarboxylase [Citricoccus muralis]